MTPRIGISPPVALNILQGYGVACELQAHADNYRIKGVLRGIVYAVDFYEPIPDTPDVFLSLRLQAGKALGITLAPTALLGICNKLNETYRHCTFAISGEAEKSVTVGSDLDIYSNPQREFRAKWEWFEKLISLVANEVMKSDTISVKDASDLHNRAIHARWGRPPDFSQALSLYRQAAELGFAGSQNNLGDAYECGEGAPKSDVVAAYWYARAAERGEPTAYMSLATLLSRTASDSETLAEAAMYALLALNHLPRGTNQIHTAACYEHIKSRLPDDLMVHAQQRAQSWSPLYQEGNLLEDTPETFEAGKLTDTCH
jgi:hypothetical protein